MRGVISIKGGRKGDIIMQRRNIQRLVFGIAVAIIASGGLYITLQQSTDRVQLTEGQGLRNPEDKPTITAPGSGLNTPENLVPPENP